MILGLTYSFSIISAFIIVVFSFLIGNEIDRLCFPNKIKTKISVNDKDFSIENNKTISNEEEDNKFMSMDSDNKSIEIFEFLNSEENNINEQKKVKSEKIISNIVRKNIRS